MIYFQFFFSRPLHPLHFYSCIFHLPPLPLSACLHFIPPTFHLPPFHSLLSFPPFPAFSRPPCPGSSVGGHDESPGDHTATDAADPPAAGSLPPAAPGLAPAAAGSDAAAGKHTTSTRSRRCIATARAHSQQPRVLDTLTKKNLKLTHPFMSPLINHLRCVAGSIP